MLNSEQSPLFDLDSITKELELIPNTITGKKRVGFKWSRGEGWYWSHLAGGPDGTITGDLADLDRYGYKYCKGVATHEPLHPVLSKDLIEQFTPEEWNQPGFAIGVNWFEDNRIEYAADDLIDGGRANIKGYLDIDVQPGHGLDFALDQRGSGEMGKAQELLGYLPAHMRFGAVARNYFYEKEIARTLTTKADLDAFIERVRLVDEDVAQIFIESLPDIERYYQTIPGRFASPEEVRQKAKEAAAIYRNFLWPKYKKLVVTAVEKHTLSTFIDDLISGKDFQGQDPQGQVVIISFDDLPPEIQDELREKLKSPASADPLGANAGESSTPEAGVEPSSSAAAPGEAATKEGSADESGEEGKTGEATDKTSAGNGNSPVDALSDEAQAAVKEAWDKIDETEKQNTKTRATQEIGDAEDKINQDLQGHSDDPGVSRPTKVSENIEKQQSDKSDESTAGQNDDGGNRGKDVGTTSSDTRMPGEQTSPQVATTGDVEELDKYFAEQQQAERPQSSYDVRLADARIQRALAELNSAVTFDPNTRPRSYYAPSGIILDIPKDIQDEMQGLEMNAFVVEGEKETVELRFLILADVSGSMSGLRNHLLDFLVLQTEFLTHQGIDNAACAYTDGGRGFASDILHVLKDFESTEGFGAVVPKEVKKEMSQVSDISFGGGGTPTSSAMLAGYEDILVPRHRQMPQNVNSRTFMIVLTDGQPTDSAPNMSPVDTAVWTQHTMYEKAKSDNMPLTILCLGIGPGTEFVRDISVGLPDDLKSELARKLTAYRSTPVSPAEATTAFADIEELAAIWPTIIEYVTQYPEEFENYVERQ